jgi:DNA-binding transcriptional LysR family regulator
MIDALQGEVHGLPTSWPRRPVSKMSEPDIAALLDFALVARHGGFGLASRASGRSKATLSRRIVELETSLDVRLFERSDLGLKLTEAGAELLERTAAPFRDISEAAEAVRNSGAQLRGRLRVSAAVLFAHAHLARIGAGFSLLHPEIELEIVAEDRIVDLVEEDVDIVIRANPSASERLVGRCIVRSDRHAVAAPDLPIPADGRAARLVYRSGERPASSWPLLTDVGPFTLPLAPALCLSTLMMVREAALHGAGVALLPHPFIREDLIAGRLRSWGTLAGAQTEIWALHTSRRFTQEKVRAFIAYLVDAFSSQTKHLIPAKGTP